MQFSWRQQFQPNRVLLGVVLLSLVVTFLRMPLVYGTFAGLVLAVVAQLYLPGYLLARALGKHHTSHPIARFAWVLACGLGLTVTLGAAARLLNIPVTAYLVGLHAVMLALAVLPSPAQQDAQPWRMTRSTLPLYVAVAASCLIVVGVSFESRYRFFGFEDQPIFISLVDWLVAHPDERPNDLPLRSRQVGVLNGDSRFDTDGWSYNQAAWVWASGVPARQIIWYDLGALFVWVAPLLAFALAYELTGREGAGAASAVALTIAGLLTLDNIVYNPAYTAYGRFAVFQINVLRQMSITIMLPLALLAALAYLRTLDRRDLVITALAGAALAAMHPIQATIFVMSAGATAVLWWLVRPERARLVKLLPLALVLGLILALPFVQRLNRSGLSAADSIVQDTAAADEPVAMVGGTSFLVLRDLPIIGTTFIRNPADVFYHPIITLAVILGLAAGWWRRRSLAAQYLFGTTLLALLVFFTPGLTELFNRVASSVGLLTAMFLIPVPLALGISVAYIVNRLISPEGKARFVPTVVRWLGVIGFLLVAGWLVYEPIPLAGSARDQLRAYNDMQALRHLQPAQAALADSLRAHLPTESITVVVTPYDVANVVIEDLPGTLITGGRPSRNLATAGNDRFMNEGETEAPWLDGDDLAFLRQWGVTHIITLADTTRLPQLVLQPERFAGLDTPSGYVVFSAQPDTQADAVDALFGEMNTVYATMRRPRWGRDGFNLILPGDTGAWQLIADQWRAILADEPDNDRARLGLAFTYTMMGADADALPLWQALYEEYPDVPLYADALASTMQAVDPAGDSETPLLDALNNPYDAARVLAARRLLTETFAYRLDTDRMARVVAVAQNDAITWDRLANLGQPDGVRGRAALFMDAAAWDAAAASLDALPRAERAPEDMVARAAIQLVRGDVPGALDNLQPTTDPDQIAANVFLHADRWANNTAAQAYYLLLGEIAQRERRFNEAEAAYSQANNFSSAIAAPYLLSTVPRPGFFGDPQIHPGASIAASEWAKSYDTPLPQLASLLSIADSRAIYAMQPEVTWTDERALTVTAIYGNVRPRGAFPIQTWRIQVVSLDSATKYAEVAVPAQFVDGALVRVTTDVTLTLPDDVPELTTALVIIEPRYNDAVTAQPALVPVVLNRPDNAAIPPNATTIPAQFGDAIMLEAYETALTDNGQLQVDLYWRTGVPLAEDYQVFVHVLDSAGVQIGGGDGAPVDNRYPTSQWRTHTTIHDLRTIPLDPAIAPGDYMVRVGLYRLADGARLAITPVDERVQADSLLVLNWTVGGE